MKNKIEKSIINLYKKRLDDLESSVKSEGDISEQVDDCTIIERMAYKEKVNIEEYINIRRKLIKKYYESKK